MANPTITNNDVGSVVLDESRSEDGLFTAGSAKTYPAGTILALDDSTQKWVPYVKGGSTNDNGTPRAVLPYDIVATAAEDYAARPTVSGVVNQDRLIIDADGDATNVDANVRAALRGHNIVCQSVAQLAQVDNPQPGGDS